MSAQLHTGDCLLVMRDLADASVDAIVTDPPYGLGFMGKTWDHAVPGVEFWQEMLRVAKPGAYLLAFGGSRTSHRMACAIEDAGWEIRDTIMWLYGSGFPKSLNVAKAVDAHATLGGSSQSLLRRRDMGDAYRPHKNAGTDGFGDGNLRKGADGDRDLDDAADLQTDAARQWQGWGTALKPAHEPIIMARKPLVGTVAANVLAYGTGGLNIDGCRVEPTGESRERIGEASQENRYAEAGGTNFAAKPGIRGGDHAGRWPANVIHDGSEEVLAGFPQASGAVAPVRGNEPSGKTANAFGEFAGRALSDQRDGGGSAARFFYCAKASRKDRDEGLGHLPEQRCGMMEDDNYPIKTGSGNLRETKRRNTHPTVKPTELMRYLVRLVTPRGGTVLDPFCGSGSTGKAAVLEGFGFVGIERDAEYGAIAKARVNAVLLEQMFA